MCLFFCTKKNILKEIDLMEGLGNVQFSYIKRPNHVESHALCSANDVAEGSTQEAHMCASCVLPSKVDRMV